MAGFPSITRRGLALAATATAIAVGVAACGGDSSSGGSASKDSKKPFRVLMVVDTTGPAKVYGNQDVIAMQAAIKYWNERGGILGRKITFDQVTTNGDPTQGVTALTKWVASNGKPDYVFPGTTGGDVTALIPAVKRMGLLAMGTVDGSVGCSAKAAQNCPTYFTPGGTLGIQPEAAAAYFAEKGYKTVGMMVEQNSYSETEITALEPLLAKAGIKVVKSEFPSTAVDLTPQFSKLVDAKVPVVFVASLGAVPGYVARARAKLGLIDSLPMVFDPGASSVDLSKLVPTSMLANTFEQIHRAGNPSKQLPGRDLLLKYAKPYGVLDQPLLISAYSWDDMILLRHATDQAKSTDPKAVAKALENLNAKDASDPNYILADTVKFTTDSHRNTAMKGDAYPVVPTGPLKDGMVQTLTQ